MFNMIFLKKFFKKDIRLLIGCIVILFFVLIMIFAPFIAPYDPTEMHYENRFNPPSRVFLLGTDEYGRDVLSRLIYGARTSLFISTSALILATVGGVLLGLVGATGSRILEILTMRLIDITFCIPPIFLAISIIAFLGPGSSNLVLIMGVLYIPQFARITYTSCISVKENEYIEAAKALGCPRFYIIIKHILPNIISPIIVQMSFSLGALILLEAGLSFLGLGILPPASSLGLMLGTAKSYLFVDGMLLLWPAVTIGIIVLTINILGDAIRDTLDPTISLKK